MKKIPTILLSLLTAIILYFLLFYSLSLSGGDESENPEMALAAFLAMTFFVHFPISWFVINKVIKSFRK